MIKKINTSINKENEKEKEVIEVLIKKKQYLVLIIKDLDKLWNLKIFLVLLNNMMMGTLYIINKYF